jgi:hypothetical protein
VSVRKKLAELERVAGRREAQVLRFVERIRERDRRLVSGAAVAAVPDDRHLVYVQLADRYVLVECAGPAPDGNAIVALAELPGDRLVVERTGPSPLPGDNRRCAFAYLTIESGETEAAA